MGGGLTSSDTCVENEFMPIANITISQNNDFKINFNDTMEQKEISPEDIAIKIYGPSSEYVFTYTAKFTGPKEATVNMNFQTSLLGNKKEQLRVEFVTLIKFVSDFSKRSVNPESDMQGYLNTQGNTSSAKALGQTAMILFFVSMGLAAISSFGGNSMEMMWGLMNTLQVLYFMSYINVTYPDNLNMIFTFLKYANANNIYLSQLTYIMIPKENFSDDLVNDNIGEKSFFLNTSDKILALIFIAPIFAFTFTFDNLNLRRQNWFMRYLYVVVEYFKYNFFIRVGLEIFLEVFMNAIVNIYFVSIKV